MSTNEQQPNLTCTVCGTPAHIGCDCTNDSPHFQEKKLEAKEVLEYAQKAIIDLKELLANQGFIEDFTSLQTREEKEGLDTAEKEPETSAIGELRTLKELQALRDLGREGEDLTNVKRELKRAWGDAIRAVDSITYEGVTYPLKDGSNQALLSLLTEKHKTDEWKKQVDSALLAFEEGIKRERARLHTILEELVERENDPRLIAALNVWGRSPNSTNDRGANGEGYHAGVTHYFEYRRSKEKAGRYKQEKTPFGIEGFIEHTDELQELLQDPTVNNKKIKKLSRIKDNSEQERLLILTDDALVVCFQNAGEPMRVISHIPQNKGGEKAFEKAVRKELEINPEEDTRFNKLGEGRTEVESW